MASKILGSKASGSILLAAARAGKEKSSKKPETASAHDVGPRQKSVSIDKILNGYKVCWSDENYNRQEAAAETFEAAAAIAKAYMEGSKDDE